MTPELARLMARAGCKTVAFGVESGNQDSLDFLRKDQNVEQTRRAIGACRDAGIETVAYVLVGIPGETPDSTMNTLHLARETGLDFIQFSTLSPFAGTALHEQALREGWLRSTRVRNPVDAEEFRETLVAPGWCEDSLATTLKKVYAGFYLRPSYLVRQAVRARRMGTLIPRAKLGVGLARWALAPGA